MFFAQHAEARRRDRRLDEAKKTVAEARRGMEETAERGLQPTLSRIHGELLYELAKAANDINLLKDADAGKS